MEGAGSPEASLDMTAIERLGDDVSGGDWNPDVEEGSDGVALWRPLPDASLNHAELYLSVNRSVTLLSE